MPSFHVTVTYPIQGVEKTDAIPVISDGDNVTLMGVKISFETNFLP